MLENRVGFTHHGTAAFDIEVGPIKIIVRAMKDVDEVC